MRVRSLVTGTVAIATAVALQLSGLSAASADPVSPATVASLNADATRAQSAADTAATASAKANAALADKQAEAAKEAAKAAEAVAKAAASGKAADQVKADAAVARAADFAAKAASAQVEANDKAATAAAKAATAAAATTDASREAASLAGINPGASTLGAALPDTKDIPDNALKSDNVQFVDNVKGVSGYPALNFVHYENLGYDVMVGNGTGGLALWSLQDPAHPVYLSKITANQLRLPGDTQDRFWEGENLTLDAKRKLVYMTRDPRGFGGNQTTGKLGLYIIDIKDPSNPVLLGFHPVPAGHTATCINDCRYVWSMGPTDNGGQKLAGWHSVPVFVTDVRDINHPYTYTQAVDTNRNDGVTAYVHSADVDRNGVVWTSGYGGVRGYWTEGKHYDPVAKVDRWATATNPIPYAGGGIPNALASGIAHNAYHVTTALGAYAKGDVIVVTEEANTSNCTNAGKFQLASIAGSYDGQSWSGTVANPFRITQLGVYTPAGKPGERTGAECSAHWFTVKGNMVAIGMYAQGTRFIDISDPMHPTQVGHFRAVARTASGETPAIAASNASAVYWHGDYVYVADYTRGVDVLKFTGNIPGKIVDNKICWNSCDK